MPTARKAGARELIAQALAEGVTKERLDSLLNAALSSEITVDAHCTNCGEEMRAKAPDVKKQLDVLVGLLEQAEGRPEQRAPGALTVVIERPAA